MTKDSYLTWSGQRSKLIVLFVAFVGGFLLIAVGSIGLRGENTDDFVLLMLIGTGVELLGGVWACISIRCRKLRHGSLMESYEG